MGFGDNLQYLRKMRSGMTQDQLAEKMNVSRQMVSRWEAEEALPEVEKIIRLAKLFDCTIDELICSDMKGSTDAYSSVRIEVIPRFRMARYVVISRQPESDVMDYMQDWAKKSGLLDTPGYELEMIGWNFPYVSFEQQNVFGLRGYVAACILPPDFTPQCENAEILWQEECRYAATTITEPFQPPFNLIPNAYKEIEKYLNLKSIKRVPIEAFPCYEFEKIYQQDGVCYMDVFVAITS